jgi:diguanylate cyclase (GGDEF)-like protein
MPDDIKKTCLRLMTQVLKTLKSTHEPEKVYDRVITLIHHVFDCQACAIVLIDPVTEYLKIETSFGISHLFQKSFRRRISTGAIGSLVWDESPIVIRNAEMEPDLAAQVVLEESFGSCACLQMSTDHRTVGYLYVAKREPYNFTQEDLALLQACADAAGLAWYKCWLVDENLRMDPIDAETGLEKYSAFQERLNAAMERATRFHEPFALIVGDVDNFKTISHTYGYTASSQLLKELGGIVKSSLRSIDGAARFGFDEFVLLRSNVGCEEARLFAESLRETIAETRFTPARINTTASLGLAVHPQNGICAEDLLLTAKKAVFEAQRSGRNKVVLPPGVWYVRERDRHTAK